jgi:hypothetical protein
MIYKTNLKKWSKVVLINLVSIILLIYFRYDWDVQYLQYLYKSVILSITYFILIMFAMWSYFISRKIKLFYSFTINFVFLLYFFFPFKIFQATPSFFTETNIFRAGSSEYFKSGGEKTYPVPEIKFGLSMELDDFPIKKIIIFILFVSILVFILLKIYGKINSSFFYLTLALNLAFLQGVLHTGLHSPYTQNYFWLRANDLANRWYVMFLIGENSGAVNGDWPIWVALEQIFWGPTSNPLSFMPYPMMVRRSMGAYFVNSASYFINSFYVWIILNSIIWALCIFLLHKIVLRYFDKNTANLSAIISTCAPILLLYYGSPFPYFIGTCASLFLFYLFDDLSNAKFGTSKAIFFISICAIVSLLYDLSPIFLTLFICTLIFNMNFKIIVRFGLLTASILPLAIHKFWEILGGGRVDENNVAWISQALDTSKYLMSDRNLYENLFRLCNSFINFFTSQMHANGFILFGLGIIGLLLSPKCRFKTSSIIFILSMGFYFTIFDWTGVEIKDYPRIFSATWFIYVIYTSYFINRLTLQLANRRLRFFIQAAAILMIIAYSNSDLIGYPHPYTALQFETAILSFETEENNSGLYVEVPPLNIPVRN